MKTAIYVLVFLLCGCAGHIADMDGSHVKSDLSVMDFNGVASRYVERPTSVGLASRKGQDAVLSVRVTRYSGEVHLILPVEHADKYIAQIDKFREWHEIATQRDDVIDKEISTLPGWGDAIGFQITASFYSAAPGRHLFVIEQCMHGCRSASTLDSFYFDIENALKLRELLIRLKTGELQHTDMSVYQ